MNFREIGLTVRDKRVYEALLGTPQCSLRTIAERTGINRGSVFESVKDLLRAGLVTRITVGKRVRYRAKDPEVLHEIIGERRQNLLLLDSDVDAYIKSLEGVGTDPSQFHFTSFYSDDEGLAAILRDVLKTCRTCHISGYRVISSPRVSRYLYNNFKHFTAERVTQQLSVMVLRQGAALGEDADLASSRFIPGDKGDTGCYTIIYGTKVAIITINQFNQTSGIIIDNDDFASVQRHLFDVSWGLANPN